MNVDRLRSDLADLAEEVAPVDLRDRTLRTSRRIGMQRTLASSAAALVMIGAATGTVFAFLPQGDVGPAPSATTPPAVVETTTPPTPSPSVTVDPSVTADPGRTDGAPVQPAGLAAGSWYYIRGNNFADSNKTVAGQLWHKEPGGKWRLATTTSNDSIMLNKVASPDGRRLAWYDTNSKPHRLRVSNIDGSQVRTLATFDGFACSNVPWWTADAGQIVFGTNGNEKMGEIIRPDGTHRRAFPQGDCADGVTTTTGLIASIKDGKVVVDRLDGSGGTTTSPKVKVPAGLIMDRMHALSGDGRRALVGAAVTSPGGCDCSRDFRHFLVDLRTGSSTEIERLPGTDKLGVGQVRHANFLPDGGFAALINMRGAADDPPSHRIAVFSADGRVTSTSDAPAGSPYGALVAYRP